MTRRIDRLGSTGLKFKQDEMGKLGPYQEVMEFISKIKIPRGKW